MTTSVVTVDRNTPYKRIARLLTEHRIGGLAVLRMGRQVAGTASRPSPERAGRRKTSTVISSRVTIPPTWDVDGAVDVVSHSAKPSQRPLIRTEVPDADAVCR
jgi:CBS domain-containing protein